MENSHKFLEANIADSHFNNDSDVKVHQLSLAIYSEFENILKSFGEQPLSALVPLVANLLEILNDVSMQKDRIIGELDVFKDHHAIMLSKHETVKADMKNMEEQLYAIEDELQDKRKELDKLKSSSSSCRKLLEMKMKSAHDHIYRLEERDKELQLTYGNLRQRYGDLFRSHVELLERIRLSGDFPNDASNVPTSTSNFKMQISDVTSCSTTATTCIVGPQMLISHKGDSPYDWGTQDPVDMALDVDGSPFSKLSYDERGDDFSNSEDKSDSADLGDVSPPRAFPKEPGPDFNVSREVSKLVRENNELEETKNALNIVIHDLLTKMEEQNSEKLQLKETLSQMQISRSSMHLHITQLESDIANLRRELAQAREAQQQLEAGETPFSRRMVFTRDEMAKILMERNQLQEDISDLRERLYFWNSQTSVGPENATLHRVSSSNKFLVFFSRLFRKTSHKPSPSVSFDQATSDVSIDFDKTRQPPPARERTDPSHGNDFSHRQLAHHRVVMGSNKKTWIPLPIPLKPCLPQPIVIQSLTSTPSPSHHCKTPVPLPSLPKNLYRRPIPEAVSSRMQVTSATAIYRERGGFLPSGELLAGRSTFFSPGSSTYRDVMSAYTSDFTSETRNLSSKIWVSLMAVVDEAANWASQADLTSIDSSNSMSEPMPVFRSQIVVVDADEPQRYIDSFNVPRSVVTCMTAVPGATKRDYHVLRLSNAVWEAIPFTEDVTIDSSTKVRGPSLDELAHTPMRPVKVDETEDDHPASIGTSNTFSSLCNFSSVVDGYNVSGEKTMSSGVANGDDSKCIWSSLRTSAFDPEISCTPSSSFSSSVDFYRVERQRFVRGSRLPPHASGAGSASAAVTAQQTVWLGCQSGDIFLHSTIPSLLQRSLQSIHLPSGITTMCHFSGRVFTGLANGHIVVFRRQTSSNGLSSRAMNVGTHNGPSHVVGAADDPAAASNDDNDDDDVTSSAASQVLAVTSTQVEQPENQLSIEEELCAAEVGGNWDLSEAVVIRCGPTSRFAVKALVVVPPALALWAAYGAHIFVIDSTGFNKLATIEIASTSTSTVKCMIWIPDGVWVSMRTEHVIRLYDAFTYEALQQVDLAHIISETIGLSGSRPLAFSAAVTALGASPDHLWVGTKGGHVICAPLKGTVRMRSLSPPNQQNQVNSPPPSCSTPLQQTVKEDNLTTVQSAGRLSALVDLTGVSVSTYSHAEAVNFFTLLSGTGPLTATLAAHSSSSSSAATAVLTSTSMPLHSSPLPPSPSDLPSSCHPLLMVSGGVGFEDHQESSMDETGKLIAKSQSHLLVWSLPRQPMTT